MMLLSLLFADQGCGWNCHLTSTKPTRGARCFGSNDVTQFKEEILFFHSVLGIKAKAKCNALPHTHTQIGIDNILRAQHSVFNQVSSVPGRSWFHVKFDQLGMFTYTHIIVNTCECKHLCFHVHRECIYFITVAKGFMSQPLPPRAGIPSYHIVYMSPT